MQIFKNSFYFFLLLLVSLQCTKAYEEPTELEIHNFVWKGLNAYYLHQDAVLDLSDRRFTSDEQLNSFLSSFTDYNSLFNSLLIPNDFTSEIVEDFTITTENNELFTSGLEYGIIEDPVNIGNVIGFITVVLPNSNASTKNITRGEFFYAVDNTVLTAANFLSLLENGNDSFTLNFANFDGVTLTPNNKNIEVTKSVISNPSLLKSTIINENGNNYGYLAFARNFPENITQELNNSILTFKNNNISDLILDFRYSTNQKTYVKTINKLASMLTMQTAGNVSIKKEWNPKAQEWFLENQPDSLLEKFTDNIKPNTPLHRINSTSLYIILGGDNNVGDPALELLINTLKPFMNITLIGNDTKGDNSGIITLYDAIDYNFKLKNANHNVALEPKVLRFYNAEDESYENGFPAIINICENENPINMADLGSNSDTTIQKIVNYIQFGTINDADCSNNLPIIYNSIRQKEQFEREVYLQQTLPNTF